MCDSQLSDHQVFIRTRLPLLETHRNNSFEAQRLSGVTDGKSESAGFLGNSIKLNELSVCGDEDKDEDDEGVGVSSRCRQ